MQTPTRSSRCSQVSAVVVLLLSPLATLAQDDGPPQAVRESSAPVPKRAQMISPRAGKALNEAIAALNAGRCDDARRAIGELRLDRLSAYERATTERVLYSIAYAERDSAAARPHLRNAIESQGLTEQETAAAQEQIKRIDAGLATSPPVASCKR